MQAAQQSRSFFSFFSRLLTSGNRITDLVDFVYNMVVFHQKRPKPAQWQAPAFSSMHFYEVLFRLFAQGPEGSDRKVNCEDNEHDSDAGLDVAPGISSLELRKDRLDQ